MPAPRTGPILGAAAALLAAACWRIGEPTPGSARVSWAAFPETAVAGRIFSFEFAGPVAPNTCGRLDTAVLTVSDSVIELSARRSVFEEAMCSSERVSFYEARPLAIERPGRYAVRSANGLEFGTLTVLPEGRFSPVGAAGEGTVVSAGGCLLFGPGWASNQRPFALRRAPPAITRQAGTDTVVWVRGRLAGYTLCGAYGSRPSIRVEEARTTTRTGEDYYDERREDGNASEEEQ